MYIHSGVVTTPPLVEVQAHERFQLFRRCLGYMQLGKYFCHSDGQNRIFDRSALLYLDGQHQRAFYGSADVPGPVGHWVSFGACIGASTQKYVVV